MFKILSLNYIPVLFPCTVQFNCTADLLGFCPIVVLAGFKYFTMFRKLSNWSCALSSSCTFWNSGSLKMLHPLPPFPHLAFVSCPSLWQKVSSTEIPSSLSVARLAVQGNVLAVRGNSDGQSLSFPQVFRTRLCMQPRLPRVIDGGTKKEGFVRRFVSAYFPLYV